MSRKGRMFIPINEDDWKNAKVVISDESKTCYTILAFRVALFFITNITINFASDCYALLWYACWGHISFQMFWHKCHTQKVPSARELSGCVFSVQGLVQILSYINCIWMVWSFREQSLCALANHFCVHMTQCIFDTEKVWAFDELF